MNHLLVFADDDSAFTMAEVKPVLEAIGCTEMREGTFIGSVLDCQFEFAAQSTIIRLADDLKTISMSNTGDAAVRAAFAIQERIDRPLRAIDTNFSFDIGLRNIYFEELRRLVNEDDDDPA